MNLKKVDMENLTSKARKALFSIQSMVNLLLHPFYIKTFVLVLETCWRGGTLACEVFKKDRFVHQAPKFYLTSAFFQRKPKKLLNLSNINLQLTSCC